MVDKVTICDEERSHKVGIHKKFIHLSLSREEDISMIFTYSRLSGATGKTFCVVKLQFRLTSKMVLMFTIKG